MGQKTPKRQLGAADGGPHVLKAFSREITHFQPYPSKDFPAVQLPLWPSDILPLRLANTPDSYPWAGLIDAP